LREQPFNYMMFIENVSLRNLWNYNRIMVGQTDEGEIGLSYDTIDEILFRIDNNLNLDDLNHEEVNKVLSLMKKAEHKNQMPPSYNFK